MDALARDSATQLTFDAGDDENPVWTPDGTRIVFASDRAKLDGPRNLYWVNADGTGEVTRLTESPEDHVPSSWHPSGTLLAFSANRAGGTGWGLMILPMEGDAGRGWTAGTPTVFLSTPASEVEPMFSPDGRFIAYASNEVAGLRPPPRRQTGRRRVATGPERRPGQGRLHVPLLRLPADDRAGEAVRRAGTSRHTSPSGVAPVPKGL